MNQLMIEKSNSVKWLYVVAAFVALIGLADAIYLMVEHIAGRNVRCTIVTGCGEVLASAYATLFGVPLAAFGALAYFTAFSLAICIVFGYARLIVPLRLLVFTMFLMSLWLFIVQAFILEAFCFYCLISAGLTCALAGIVIADFLTSRRRFSLK